MFKNNTLAFDERCYQLLLDVPKGKVTTYKALAKQMEVDAFQAIGGAMSRNKNLIAIPCHRVVYVDGRVGNYVLGASVKESLLKMEGILIKHGRVCDLESHLYIWTDLK